MATEGDWRRLGRAIENERATHLGNISARSFARASGLSPRLLYSLEKGERDNYTDATLAALEYALGWSSGSIKRVLSGGQPRRVDPELATLRRCWPKLSKDSKRMLARLAEEAAGLR